MQLVMLGGELGEKYGTEHKYYNLRSPAEAIKLLCINYPALQKDLIEAHDNGIGYKVIQGGAAMGYDELALPFGSRPLMVVPVITGSGGSTGQILLGVGLVAASVIFAPAAAGFLGAGLGVGSTTTAAFSLAQGAYIASTSAVLSAGLSTAIGSIGAALVLGGVANLVSPQPEVPRLAGNRLNGGTNVRGTGPQGITRGASGEQSYAFTGPVNTVGTGATIPVIYGRVITGGHLVSLDIDICDESDPLRKRLGRFNRQRVKINDEKISNSIESAGGLNTRRIDGGLSFTTDRDKRVSIEQTFGPTLNALLAQDNESLFIENDRLKYKKDKAEKLDVVFKLTNNFYDHVGDETTTIIDAFISYTITLKLGGGGLGNTIVASAGATLQGKFKSKNRNPFTYGHRLEVPESSEAKDIKIEVEITDASVNDAVTFTLVGYGYELF